MDNQTNNPSDPGAVAPSDQAVPGGTPPAEPVQEPAQQPSWPQPEVNGGVAPDQSGAVGEEPAQDPNAPAEPENGGGEQGGNVPAV